MRRLIAALTLCACLPLTTVASESQAILSALQSPQGLLIDVRTAEEFAAGALPGATRIGHEQIAEQIASLAPDKHQLIILYCRSGRRSGLAEQRLRELGYSNLINAGGYEALKTLLESGTPCATC
ncbi:rhodanese-like domain-containing protein [Pseudomonas xionganensis]|uniref:Rhodanese-like domain-containing protein n=1 Tax=Pseudomonas xionganensis TaxID=2654845 RepID=A0A6I4KWU4_9PSED|nr:rhodanese-like domain-containing protein [Pseudomonas xionganensis]MVW77159.1 rhodanese-like domain-containing protein [Pseudomonas xionganensis]